MDDAEDRSCEAADGNECLDGGDVPRGLQARANLVFIGPCGCGKSTTAGRFIADCDAIDADSLARIAREASAAGKENQKFAWILDKLRCERERGCTRSYIQGGSSGLNYVLHTVPRASLCSQGVSLSW